ncbi:MAG: Ig-like domain-containing protein [Cyclobacteriaceae bacterium]
MKHLFPILTILGIIYISSCANQGSPTGGPRDTIPPSLTESNPPHKSLNFKGKEFEFTFDERVSADQLTQKLNITPRIENKFKVLMKKYTMKILFEENFDDSTTYTFNFADGVGDITEKNPVINFTYAFSTGPIIDSIYVNGNVKDLYENENQKEILVALYSISDTLDLFTGKPRYFTKTDEEGNYLIENIKTDHYRIYAWEDKDNNQENNPQKEPHGFIADSLDLFTSKDSVRLKIQLIDASTPEFVRAKNTGLYFDILYNKYIDHYILKKLNSSSKLKVPANNFFKDNTIIRFYPDNSLAVEKDSLYLSIQCFDSLGNHITDSLYIKFKESKRKPEDFKFTLSPTTKYKLNTKIPLTFTFSKPISNSTIDSIKISYDSLQSINIQDSTLNWNDNKTELKFELTVDKKLIPYYVDSLQKKWFKEDSLLKVQYDLLDSIGQDSLSQISRNPRPKLPEPVIRVFIPAATFISVDNDSTALLEQSYRFINQEKTGEISVEIETEETHYILQLVNKNYKVIKEVDSPVKHTFRYVEPGKYTFRVLIDKNKDGKWTSGNILEDIEPEPIWFHPETFDLKAGWSIELLKETEDHLVF